MKFNKSLIVIALLHCNFLALFSQSSNNCNLSISEIEIIKLTDEINKIDFDSNFQLLIIGENHFYEFTNVEIDLIFFKTFINKSKNTDIIMEIPHAYALLINNYLEKNDTIVFRGYEDSCDYIRNLKQLKNIFDNSHNKFKVHGIDLAGNDFKYQTELALRRLFIDFDRELLNLELDKNFKELIRLLKLDSEHHYPVQRKKFQDLCNKVYNYYTTDENHEFSYSKQFGSSWSNIARIIEDYCLGLKYRDKRNINLEVREKILYQRCYNLINNNPDKKYVAKFGNNHIKKAKINLKDYTSFSSHLASNGINVLSIYTTYTYFSKTDLKMKWKYYQKQLKNYEKLSDKIIRLIEPIYLKDNNTIITCDEEAFEFLLILNKPLSYY